MFVGNLPFWLNLKQFEDWSFFYHRYNTILLMEPNKIYLKNFQTLSRVKTFLKETSIFQN